MQTRINKYLIWVMLQRKEDILPQLYKRSHAAIVTSLSASARPQSGTARPLYATVPDAAMELLLCVPPFHTPLSRVKFRLLGTDYPCSFNDLTIASPSVHRVDFASFMCTAGGHSDDNSSLWALYMGPVYVYDNE